MRIDLQTGEKLGIHPRHALRGFDQTAAVGIFADGDQRGIRTAA